MPLHASVREPITYMWSCLRPKGDMPPHGCCHSLINYKDEFLILFGGGALHFVYNEVHFFNLKTRKWKYIETINSEIVAPRVSHSAVIFNDKMYVYGGQDLHVPTLLSDVLVLDLINFTWSKLHEAPAEPEGPGDRRLHTAHIYKDNMYVLMGEPCHTSINFWYMNLIHNTWHQVQSIGNFGKPILPLCGHSAQVEGDRLFVFGGYRVNAVSRTGSFVYSNSIFCYHFINNSWSEIIPRCGPTPGPRYSAAMIVLSGRVYIHGGDTDGEVYFDDFWTIDTNINSNNNSINSNNNIITGPHWVDITLKCGKARPSARSGHVAAISKGTFYIYGGELPGDTHTVYYSNHLYQYPLGLFTQLPLQELAARWLVKSNYINLHLLQERISLVARENILRYLPIEEVEDVDSLVPCMKLH